MDPLIVLTLAEELLGLGRRAVEAGTDVADEAVEEAHQKAKAGQRDWKDTIDKRREEAGADGREERETAQPAEDPVDPVVGFTGRGAGLTDT